MEHATTGGCIHRIPRLPSFKLSLAFRCRYLNDSGSEKFVCREGNITLGPTTRWGVVLFQTVAFVSHATVVSGRRGLLAVLGSVGGAYSIIFTFAALLYKFLWFLRARNGWTDTVRDAPRASLKAQDQWQADPVPATAAGTGAEPARDTPATPATNALWHHARKSLFGISPVTAGLTKKQSRSPSSRVTELRNVKSPTHHASSTSGGGGIRYRNII